jgi:adenylate cyclase
MHVALFGQWRYSINTDKLSAVMRIAERLYSFAQQQSDPTPIMGAYTALAITHYMAGNFETSGQYAMRAVQIWRSGGVQCLPEELDLLPVTSLCYEAMTRWHLGETASPHALVAEAISLAKELNDMHGLAVALSWAAMLGQAEHNPSEVERLTSELIELSTRQYFPHWLAIGTVLRGWGRTASGDPTESLLWIEDGMEQLRTEGSIVNQPYHLTLRAECLYLAGRTSEALAAITEAEAVAQRSEVRVLRARLHRLRGVFLAALGAEETQIEASFSEAIRIAKEQKSVSSEKRAEATYAEYRRQKASGSGGRGFRLPLC